MSGQTNFSSQMKIGGNWWFCFIHSVVVLCVCFMDVFFYFLLFLKYVIT